MRSQKIEFIFYLLLWSLFGWFTIATDSRSNYYLVHSIFQFAFFGGLLFLARYFVLRKLKEHKFWAAAIILFSAVGVSFLISGYLYAFYIEDLIESSDVPIWEPLVLESVLPFIVAPVIIGLLTILKFGNSYYRKALPYIGVLILVIITVFVIKFISDAAFKGKGSISFVDGEHGSLESILNQPQFADKIVYIDLWYSSCSPCLEDFGELPKLKPELEQYRIEYLYLARETSHPNSYQRWKSAIKKYNLKGWHVYMSEDLRDNVWELIERNSNDGIKGYPRYLLVNKSSLIVSYNAPRPSETLELIEEISQL